MVDVEFLAQYLQLKNGFNSVALRTQNTLEILRVLAENGILAESEAEKLINGYKFLRRLENKLRLLYDQSMNELSGEKKKMRKVARSLGYGGKGLAPEEEFLEEYRMITEGLRDLFEACLNPQRHELSGEDA